jgi:hypothetical protein
MSKMAWKAFVKQQKRPLGFSAAVSASLPKNLVFDNARNKLPTPYTLFLEWASANLSGAWASIKVPGGFIICVADDADASVITRRFGVIGAPKKTPACASTQQIRYVDSDYAKLAKAMGYKL